MPSDARLLMIASEAAASVSRRRQWSSRALWVCAIVLAAAMLSFYVQLLKEQVQRGERLRAGQQAAAAQSVALVRLAP